MEKDLKDYRKSYEKDELSEGKLPSVPLQLFAEWFKDAESHPGVLEPNAMSLATIGEDNFPKTRVVLLKSFSSEGFTFFTNYKSEKGKSLTRNPNVCLSFFWPELERQVIIKGVTLKISEEESAEYFNSRPRGSQFGALASNQSEEIISRQVLLDKLISLEEQYKDLLIPKPKNWGGYIVKPISFEFWQGRQNRLHDRILYTTSQDLTWTIKRLAP